MATRDFDITAEPLNIVSGTGALVVGTEYSVQNVSGSKVTLEYAESAADTDGKPTYDGTWHPLKPGATVFVTPGAGLPFWVRTALEGGTGQVVATES